MGIFFTDEMKLRALLDGDFATNEKPKVFDPIYGPTPFKPHQTGVIIAMFEKQICARCHKSTYSYTGLFREVAKGNTKLMHRVEPGMGNPESKELTCTTIPACFECL